MPIDENRVKTLDAEQPPRCQEPPSHLRSGLRKSEPCLRAPRREGSGSECVVLVPACREIPSPPATGCKLALLTESKSWKTFLAPWLVT